MKAPSRDDTARPGPIRSAPDSATTPLPGCVRADHGPRDHGRSMTARSHGRQPPASPPALGPRSGTGGAMAGRRRGWANAGAANSWPGAWFPRAPSSRGRRSPATAPAMSPWSSRSGIARTSCSGCFRSSRVWPAWWWTTRRRIRPEPGRSPAPSVPGSSASAPTSDRPGPAMPAGPRWPRRWWPSSTRTASHRRTGFPRCSVTSMTRWWRRWRHASSPPRSRHPTWLSRYETVRSSLDRGEVEGWCDHSRPFPTCPAPPWWSAVTWPGRHSSTRPCAAVRTSTWSGGW